MDWMQQGFDMVDPDGAERRRQQRQQEDRMARARSYYDGLRQRSDAMSGGPGISSVVDHAFNTQAAQANHLQGAANNLMGAIQGENQSRVAQEREMRRMQHEKELMRMRAEADIYGAAIRSLLG